MSCACHVENGEAMAVRMRAAELETAYMSWVFQTYKITALLCLSERQNTKNNNLHSKASTLIRKIHLHQQSMMLFTNLFVFLALSCLSAAVPGYSVSPSQTSVVYGVPPPPAKETICTPLTCITSIVGEGKTTYFSTKTVVVPVPTVIEKPSTAVSPCPYTTTGTHTTTVTSLTTNYWTKTYPTVTTIYNTKVESAIKSFTHVETTPFTSTGTSYKTNVATTKETVTVSVTTVSVVTETAKVPSTYVSTSTKTVCTTKGGYGGGY